MTHVHRTGRATALTAFLGLLSNRASPLDDRQLLDCYVQRRDDAAFATLIQRHGERVLAACRQVLRDEADVEDAFQATFLVLLRHVRSPAWRADLGGWLFVVAHRLSVRMKQTAARRRERESQVAVPEATAGGPSDPSLRDAIGLMHQELDRLPDNFREPLLLCYVEGLSRDQAARQLGLSLGSVKGRLERGREALRRRLVRRGLTLSVGLLAAVAAPRRAHALCPRLVTNLVNAAGGTARPAVAALVEGMAIPMLLNTVKCVLAVAVMASLLSAVMLRGWFQASAEPPAPDVTAVPANKDARPVLLAALSELERGKPLLFHGEVTDSGDDFTQVQAKGQALITTKFVFNAAGSEATPFTGRFEAWRTDAGELVIVSEKALPGLGVYLSGDRCVVRTTFEDKILSPRAFSGDLPQLLDFAALKKYAAGGTDLKCATKDREYMFRLPLSPRLLRGTGEPAGAVPKAEVLGVEASFVCPESGGIRSLQFKVLRSNPWAAILEKEKNKGPIPIEGVNSEAFKKLILDQLGAKLKEGEATTFTLTVGTGEPSARVKEFAATMRKELKK